MVFLIGINERAYGAVGLGGRDLSLSGDVLYVRNQVGRSWHAHKNAHVRVCHLVEVEVEADGEARIPLVLRNERVEAGEQRDAPLQLH